ncbi:hypothetical protein [Ornithinimicrobium cerasi]|uniref:hypothetical protein n=1 Tax=Ornithinimicrobium cerasi TaxID=2248773 RepID=UPI000BE4867A|nr:hypothetical protein [Ornithinimicrobium cerasi]
MTAMLMAGTSAGSSPPIPFLPELLVAVTLLLVLAMVVFWVVMVVRNRGRQDVVGSAAPDVQGQAGEQR